MSDLSAPFYKMAGMNYFIQMEQCHYLADKLFMQLCKELEQYLEEWVFWTAQGDNLTAAQELEINHKLASLPNTIQCVVYSVPGKHECFFFRRDLFTYSLALTLRPLPSAHWLAWELQAICQVRSAWIDLSFDQEHSFAGNQALAHGTLLPIIQRTLQTNGDHSQGNTLQTRPSPPLISIILSVHNMESTIGWSIRSVLAQDFQNFELLIGDDASTDKTVQQVSVMASDARIRLFRYSVNRGKAFVLNDLLREARGRYALELDGDDWLPVTALGSLLKLMEHHPNAGLGTGTSLVWRKTRDGHYRLRGQARFGGLLETENHGYPPVPRIYPIQLLREVGGWTEYEGVYGRIFEDIEVCRKLLKNYDCVQTREVVYHRMVHTGSVSQQHLHLYKAWKQNRILHERGGEST